MLQLPKVKVKRVIRAKATRAKVIKDKLLPHASHQRRKRKDPACITPSTVAQKGLVARICMTMETSIVAQSQKA